jgi:hypothetical protein
LKRQPSRNRGWEKAKILKKEAQELARKAKTQKEAAATMRVAR